MLNFGKTSYNDFVLERGEYLRLVGAPKKSLSWLELGKTSYKHLVFAQIEFLSLVGAPNDSLRLIIIYNIFIYTFGIKTT